MALLLSGAMACQSGGEASDPGSSSPGQHNPDGGTAGTRGLGGTAGTAGIGGTGGTGGPQDTRGKDGSASDKGSGPSVAPSGDGSQREPGGPSTPTPPVVTPPVAAPPVAAPPVVAAPPATPAPSTPTPPATPTPPVAMTPAPSTPAPSTPTPPVTPTPAPGKPLRIAVVGDFGADVSDEAKVAALVTKWAPDHVITLGDNNYPAGAAATIDANIGKHYQAFIGSYKGKYGAGSATNRLWPAPGNHDWVAPGLTPYTDYFTLPGNERYYDVDLGLIHLYAVDSDGHEPDGNKVGSKQASWLQGRLGASKSCYDVVYFHHPPLSSGDHGSNPEMAWPFESWGAESVLAGHDHHYERFQVGGIPYFVNGLGGAGLYPLDKPPLPETKFRYDQKHGAMLITATSTGITYEAWNVDGVKIDSLTVPKTCS